MNPTVSDGQRQRLPLPPKVVDPARHATLVAAIALGHEWIDRLIAEVNLPTGNAQRTVDGARAYLRTSRGRLGL